MKRLLIAFASIGSASLIFLNALVWLESPVWGALATALLCGFACIPLGIILSERHGY